MFCFQTTRSALAFILLVGCTFLVRRNVLMERKMSHTSFEDENEDNLAVRYVLDENIGVLAGKLNQISSKWEGPGTSWVKEIGPNNFGGLVARPYKPWPKSRPLPCFQAETDWKSYQRQNNGGVQEGFMFQRPFKCGSTSSIGMVLRFLHKLARNKGYDKPAMCLVRFDHGWTQPKWARRFKSRSKQKSFLWSIIRDPTLRTISQYYFFRISHARHVPSDDDFHGFLGRARGVRDYYLKSLSTEEEYPGRGNERNSKAVEVDLTDKYQQILSEYDFIGITERFDESAVVLMMLLDIPMGDMLYLSVKQAGGFDYAWNMCMYIVKPYISPNMQTYFDDSKEWKDHIKYDAALYRAVNRSLDLTIDQLGRKTFESNLQKYQNALKVAQKMCASKVVHRCTEGGDKVPMTGHECLWDNAACGMSCLDQVARDLNLPMTPELPDDAVQ